MGDVGSCLEKCEGLKDEAYGICVDQCYRFGDYDPIRVKVAYARALAEQEDNWW